MVALISLLLRFFCMDVGLANTCIVGTGIQHLAAMQQFNSIQTSRHSQAGPNRRSWVIAQAHYELVRFKIKSGCSTVRR